MKKAVCRAIFTFISLFIGTQVLPDDYNAAQIICIFIVSVIIFVKIKLKEGKKGKNYGKEV